MRTETEGEFISLEMLLPFSVVPIDGDYSTLDEYTKIDFEESYNLLTNNCSHYVIAWLAQNYNGKLLSKEFFDTINLNPVPAISSAITSVAMAFSWVANEIHGLWNKIVN